jgi:hypothetical protein
MAPQKIAQEFDIIVTELVMIGEDNSYNGSSHHCPPSGIAQYS